MSDNPSISNALNTILYLSSNFPTPPHASTPSFTCNIPSPSTSPLSQSSDIFKYTISNCAVNVNACTNPSRTINNILLILFRNHPHGLYESQLPLFYHQTFSEIITINHDLKYLLLTHPSIHITSAQQGDLLYTLNPNQMSHTLASFDPFILKPYVAEHVLRLFNYFPNGIAVSGFEETLHKLSQFKLSTLIPSWVSFVTSIPGIICTSINGVHLFINTFKTYEATNVLLNCIQQSANDAPLLTDKSPYFEDHCSVFMGGFAHGTTANDIRRALIAAGFVVMSCSEIKYRKYGFSWVTLSSTKQADDLMNLSPIKMFGRNIDVRPYINREKQQKDKPEDTVILQSVIQLLLKSKYNALSIREIQPILFRMLSYRVSGSDLVEIIKKNMDILCIKEDELGQEKILFVRQ